MKAKKFLKNANLATRYRGDEDSGEYMYYESDVTYIMKKYHEAKVKKLGLFDVITRLIINKAKELDVDEEQVLIGYNAVDKRLDFYDDINMSILGEVDINGL